MTDIVITVKHSELFASSHIDMLPVSIGDYPIEEMADLDGHSVGIELAESDIPELITFLQTAQRRTVDQHEYVEPADQPRGACAYSFEGIPDRVVRHCRMAYNRHLRIPAILSGMRTVTIPGCIDHAGYHAITITLPWVCPTCGGPRGEPYQGFNFDGSRRLSVDCWSNACGHRDVYIDLRKEAGVKSCQLNAHG